LTSNVHGHPDHLDAATFITACGIAGAHQDFNVQSDKAGQAIDKLEHGKATGWSEIGAALEVPSNP
jgi:hypothetical protein